MHVRADALRLLGGVDLEHVVDGDAVRAGKRQDLLEARLEGLVELAVAEDDFMGDWYGDNPYNQASPGILVQFAIMSLVTSGQILVQERKTRTLQRMISTSMRAWEIIAGHTLAMFGVVFFQIALLVVLKMLQPHFTPLVQLEGNQLFFFKTANIVTSLVVTYFITFYFNALNRDVRACIFWICRSNFFT